MGTAFNPAKTSPASWDAFSDVDAFVDAVLAELAAMAADGTRSTRSEPKPPLTGAALRKAIMSTDVRIGPPGDMRKGSPVQFSVITAYNPWWSISSVLGLWRRLGRRLALVWRLAQGDEVLPSAVVVDSRSLRSAPSAWTRGIDGGKLIKGVKLLVICDKHGSLLDLELQPANVDDRAGALPMLPRLAALGFQGDLPGDSGFRGAPFAAAAPAHDVHVSASPGGTPDGRFLPSGIRWVVERLLAWLSRYRRLNVVFDREPDLFAAHVWIAIISIISRRLVAQAQAEQGI